MSHVRTQIRQQIATLVSGLATTGSRVFQSRMRPQDGTGLPCLLVMTSDEKIDATALASGPLDRVLDVDIRGFASGADADNTLDQIALEVEGVLGNRYLLRSIEVDFDDSLERPVGSITLRFEYLYFTPAGNPGVLA